MLSYFLMAWTDWQLLSLTALGVFAGIYIGAIPGLSVTMAVSILISFTFSWEVNHALSLMAGIFMGGVYGGSRTAILLNIPGSPASIATAFDGYPLAQKGEAGNAIGLSTVMSFVGGLVGIVFLAIATPSISEFALTVQPRDYFLLGLIGVFLVGALSTHNLARGIFAGTLGLMIGFVGLDPVTSDERFTFGVTELWGGISPIVVMIGLFGVAEALNQLRCLDRQIVKQAVDKIIPAWADVRRYLPLSLQTSVIGVIIGSLPGTGGDIASLIAYDYAKRKEKFSEVPFGQGCKAGLIAPESANNAAVGGAYIPMLALGIPGDAVTAVMIGALFVHGLNPGPLLLVQSPHLFWFTVGNLLLANCFLLIFGLTGIKIFSKIVQCPRSILIPLILLLSMIGAYAINSSLFDMAWVLVFGVLGYVMRHYGYPVAPVVLGVILSSLVESNWRRAIISSHESPLLLLKEIISSPLSLVLFLLVLWIFFGRFLRRFWTGKVLPSANE